MKITSSTYRFLAIITVLTVLGSISLPACLYAKKPMAAFCSNSSVHQTESFSKMVGGGDMHMSAQHLLHYRSQKRDMDTAMTCCLSPNLDGNRLFLKGETGASTHTQAKVILPVAAFDFTAEFQSVDYPHEIPEPNLNSPPPPVFLVNSTFLN